MKTYLCYFTPTRPSFPGDATESELSTVGEHFNRLHLASESGMVRLAGRTQEEHPVGLLIFHAVDEQAAEDFVAEDPCVKAKIFNYKIHPYSIAIWASELT